jgi:hypothetical protein
MIILRISGAAAVVANRQANSMPASAGTAAAERRTSLLCDAGTSYRNAALQHFPGMSDRIAEYLLTQADVPLQPSAHR